MSPEKLPRSFARALKLMAEVALSEERMALARAEAAAELADQGMSSAEISDLFKEHLAAREDLSARHLKVLGLSPATMRSAAREHRIRTGKA